MKKSRSTSIGSFGTVMIAAFMLAAVMTLIGPERAYACSCALSPGVKQDLESSTAVFAGHITSMIDADIGNKIISSADPIRVTFNVSKVWKGKIAEKTTISTARSSASCGYAFADGGDYLVYAYGDEDGKLHTGLCSSTKPLAGAGGDIKELDKLAASYEPGEEIKLKDEGRPLVSPGDTKQQAIDGKDGGKESSGLPYEWIGAIVVIAAIAGALLYYRRRE